MNTHKEVRIFCRISFKGTDLNLSRQERKVGRSFLRGGEFASITGFFSLLLKNLYYLKLLKEEVLILKVRAHTPRNLSPR